MDPETRIYNGYIYEQQADGSWRRMGPAPQQGPQPITVGRPDPTAPYQGPQAAAQARNAQVDANVNAATQNAQVRQAEAQATQAEIAAQQAQREAGQSSQQTSTAAANAYAELSRIIEKIDNVAADAGDANGWGETGWTGSALRGIPGTAAYGLSADLQTLDANAAFTALQQMREASPTGGALGQITERELDLLRSSIANLDPNQSQSDFQDRLAETRQYYTDMQLRILNSGVLPPDAQARAEQDLRRLSPSVWEQQRITGGQDAPTAAAFGSETRSIPIPPEMQAEYEQWMMQRLPTGFTDAEYQRMRHALDAKYGFEAPPGHYSGYADRVQEVYQQGGDLNLTISPFEVPMTEMEQIRNNISVSPAGTFGANFADMATLGGASALAGREQLAAMNAENPMSALGGQIVGGVTGAGLTGAIGRNTLGRVAPRLMGGGGRAQFGRNLATDTAYATTYSGMTGGDMTTDALLGAASSAVGQGLGSVVGRGLTGIRQAPEAQRLRAQGVDPTIGQIFRSRANARGGDSIVAGLEDLGENSGWLGSPIRAARRDTLEQANIAGYNVGARGAGRVTRAGDEGIQQLEGISGDAYSNALSGVQIPMSDPRFGNRMAAAIAQGNSVDAARGVNSFDIGMQRSVLPILGRSPTLSGEGLQDAMQALGRQSRSYRRVANQGQDPAAEYVADAFDNVQGAITGAAGDYAPGAVEGLQEANRIYRNLAVLDDAAGAAMNNDGIWTGAQLGQAMKRNANQFRTGRRGLSNVRNSDFRQLQSDMQEILPNQVPPTGVNAAPALALLGLGGAAASQTSDNEYVQGLGALGALGLLATPYTKTGRRAAASALLDRPDTARQIGDFIRRRGLFGSAATGAMIGGQ